MKYFQKFVNTSWNEQQCLGKYRSELLLDGCGFLKISKRTFSSKMTDSHMLREKQIAEYEGLNNDRYIGLL